MISLINFVCCCFGQIQTVVDQMLAALVIIFLHTFLIICRNIAGISKSLSESS